MVEDLGIEPSREIGPLRRVVSPLRRPRRGKPSIVWPTGSRPEMGRTRGFFDGWVDSPRGGGARIGGRTQVFRWKWARKRGTIHPLTGSSIRSSLAFKGALSRQRDGAPLTRLVHLSILSESYLSESSFSNQTPQVVAQRSPSKGLEFGFQPHPGEEIVRFSSFALKQRKEPFTAHPSLLPSGGDHRGRFPVRGKTRGDGLIHKLPRAILLLAHVPELPLPPQPAMNSVIRPARKSGPVVPQTLRSLDNLFSFKGMASMAQDRETELSPSQGSDINGDFGRLAIAARSGDGKRLDVGSSLSLAPFPPALRPGVQGLGFRHDRRGLSEPLSFSLEAVIGLKPFSQCQVISNAISGTHAEHYSRAKVGLSRTSLLPQTWGQV